MGFTKRFAGALAGLSFALCTAQVVAAAESGSFEIVFGFATQYTTIEHAGQKVTGGALNGVSTFVKSSGGPFAEGANGTGTCIVYATASDAGLAVEAACTVTDAAGDSLFLAARRSAGDIAPAGGGEGRMDLVGGTGKFAGATGTCPYTVQYLPENKGITHIACAWQKP